MAFTKLGLCSQALGKIGVGEIASFADGTAEADIARYTYPLVKKRLLSTYPWSFALKRAALARLENGAFQLPNDFLRAVKVFPNAEYRISGGSLFIPADKVEMEYVCDADEASMSPMFASALVCFLAAEFALSLLDDGARHSLFARAAAMELREARLQESQQQSPRRIRSFPLIDSRG